MLHDELITLRFQLQTKLDTRKHLETQLAKTNDEILQIERSIRSVELTSWNAAHGTHIHFGDKVKTTPHIRNQYLAKDLCPATDYEDKYEVNSECFIKGIDTKTDRIQLSQDGCIRWFDAYLIRDAMRVVQS